MSVRHGARDEIRVGVTWSNSGWCWLESRMIPPGVEIWVRETNARGGMFVPEEGRRLPVRLVWADDRSDPATEAAAVARMCAREKIDVFCSSASSAMQREALPITEDHRILNLNIGSPDARLFEAGHRFHLQCSSPAHHEYLRSRPAFWKEYGLTRVAQLYADSYGWSDYAAPLASYVAEAGGLELVLHEPVAAIGSESTEYGPYPDEFDRWDEVVAALVEARPDAVVVSLPAPAQYRIMRELRRRRVWFPYLEMMYGLRLAKAGFGPEDLLFQFQGWGTPRVPADAITVGCTQQELDRMARTHLGIDEHVYGRGFVALAIWEELVHRAGTMDAAAVMDEARSDAGTIVTMYGDMRWRDNGNAAAVPEGWMRGVAQFRRHERTAELRPVEVFPEAKAAPVLTRLPYEDRPAPWAAHPGGGERLEWFS